MTFPNIPISKIIQDPRLQVRTRMSPDTVADYAERMHEGDTFPPVELFDVDGQLFLVNGFHRLRAALKEGWEEIAASITKGTFSDAILAACRGNRENSLQMTREDKRQAVALLLADPT